MNKWSGGKGGHLSHTLMNGGSLCVPICDNDEFFETYVKTAKSGKVYAVELKTPTFKFFMDIDYVSETKLSSYEIVSMAHEIHKLIPGRCFVAVAKPKPKDNLVKSGIHLHWPDLIVTKSQAIELMNKIDNKFIDDSVYKGSGLRMLWSHKKTKTGDEDPYLPFYDVENKTFYEKQAPSVELLKLFSIRCDTEEAPEEEKKAYATSTDLEVYLYTCMIQEMKFLNIKDQLDTFRVLKMYPFKSLIYVQTCSRFCLNKRTTHKSNHVYFVVDPIGGTVHQRCFDEGCKKYNGTLHKLSPRIVENIRKDVFDPHTVVDDFHSAFAFD